MFGDTVGRLWSAGGLVPVDSLQHTCHLRVARARVVVSLRALVQLLALAFVPLLASAQAPTMVPRVGVLLFDSAPSGGSPDSVLGGVQRGLREFGYVEGRNVVFERRYADGRPDRLPALAIELVRLKVDLILTGGPATREAASQATRVIPIVALSGSDPVREGWAESLARPGGNVTGLTVTFPELDSKRVQLLKEAFPALERVGVLFAPDEVGNGTAYFNAMRTATQPLRVELVALQIHGPNDLDSAFELARQRRLQAIYVVATNTTVTLRVRIAELARIGGLPSIGEFPLQAQAGVLITYGADLDDLGRRSIAYMDKILKGARAGDLPIERPTKFLLQINLKTAKALGVVIPRGILARADEVIE